MYIKALSFPFSNCTDAIGRNASEREAICPTESRDQTGDKALRDRKYINIHNYEVYFIIVDEIRRTPDLVFQRILYFIEGGILNEC